MYLTSFCAPSAPPDNRLKMGTGSERIVDSLANLALPRGACPLFQLAPRAKTRASLLRPSRRRAVTLIELLIALAITMIMMGAVVTMFGLVGDGVASSRSIIEISQRLSAARNRLQADLAGRTATMLPPLRPEAGEGYFEYIEGPSYDAQFASAANGVQGDCDDVLMLTVRSSSEPFVGRVVAGGNTVTLESQAAEIIWFTVPSGRVVPTATSGVNIQLYTLYRRVLLVDPQVQSVNGMTLATYFSVYDISARLDPSVGAAPGSMVANSLGDLTKRENRFYHFANGSGVGGFPFPVNLTTFQTPNTTNAPATGAFPALAPTLVGARLGEDVILSDVLAFDIKAYDPMAVNRVAADGTLLVPSDIGYNAGVVPSSPSPVFLGAYVDLNYTQQVSSLSGPSYFSGLPTVRSYFAGNQFPSYDTWSLSTEQNGIDEDSSGTADQGVDGLDSPVNSDALPPPPPANASGLDNVVDNAPTITPPSVPPGQRLPAGGAFYPGERETAPPYPIPLRGVQIKIRVYEPDSRQVREVTVLQNFVPE